MDLHIRSYDYCHLGRTALMRNSIKDSTGTIRILLDNDAEVDLYNNILHIYLTSVSIQLGSKII